MDNVKKRWLKMVKAYQIKNQKAPESIAASRNDEFDWLELTADEIGGPLASAITVQGVRAALPRFLGIPIVWDVQRETEAI